MAARTIGCKDKRLRSAVCALVVLSCVFSHGQSLQQDVIEVSYFPNSHHNFGYRGKLSEAELHQELGVLQLKNELDPAFRSSSDEGQNWNVLREGFHGDLPHFRRKRDIKPITATKEVDEGTTGVLLNFRTHFNDDPNINMGNRAFTINTTTTGNPEMLELTPAGQVKLREGYQLDYEDDSMRTITFVVHATSVADTSDVYEITTTITVADVDEPPVFQTRPFPYLATVRSDTGAGYVLITLVAEDPEGANVSYEKLTVSQKYQNRIELRTVTENGQRKCQLVTVGSTRFTEDDTFSITVAAKDRPSNGLQSTTSVDVLVGVRPPQFYQSNYQGNMPEKNRIDQTVYKLGSPSEELRVEWKTFQAGPVTLSLTGSDAPKFDVQREGENSNRAYIVCKQVLDYEDANPKVNTLTLRAVQRVGNIDLINTVSMTVEIIDINDNKPVFDRSQYLATVKENVGTDKSILNVIARDQDTGLNAEIVYSLLDTEDFEIITESSGDPPTYKGVIRAKRKLDYDGRGPYYNFKVKATDRGTLPQTSTSNIRVTVTNVNDEYPQFLNDPGEEYSVQELAAVNQYIIQIVATDRDGDRVSYSFANGGQVTSKFRIDGTTGWLTLNQRIEDNDDRFTLTIVARDDGSCCPLEGSSSNVNQTTIYVQVYGVNRHRPDFKSCSQYAPSVDENKPAGTSVIRVLAEDGDRGPNGVVSYTLTQSQNEFAINRSTGLITVRTPIDREQFEFRQVTVKATDGGSPAEESYCSFRVTINDVNDNAPRFDKNQYVANITIGVPVNVSFLSVRAYDDDVGTNARVIYSLPDNADGRFSIIPENGFISLARALQASDERQSFNLTAMARDEGSPSSLSATVSVRVNVERGTTEPPAWDQDYNQLTYNIDETEPAGSAIIPNMTCNSNIPNKNVEFQLVKEDGTTGPQTDFFYITTSGRSNVTVHARGTFDYATKRTHIIHIRCLSFGSVPLVNETNPKVELRDTNNKGPVFQGLDDKGRFAAAVQENKPANTVVGTVAATDEDATSPYNDISFSILEGGENFTIGDGTKPNTAIIRTRRAFNREERPDYYVKIEARDGAPSSLPNINGPNTATVFMYVRITDVNDNPPKFEYSLYNVSVPESTYINDLIYPAIKADDADDTDNGRHSYRILQGNTNEAFGIRNRQGNLFPRRKLDYEGQDKFFLLEVEASDGLYTDTTRVNVTIVDVNDNSPVFSQDVYTVRDVVENDDSNLPRPLVKMTATDADVNRDNRIRYSLEGSSFPVRDFFTIDEVTGQLYLVQKLDRDPPEGRPNYQFTVKAADEVQDPNFGYATVSVIPKDLNDNAPQFVTDPLEASVEENSASGALVVRLEAEDNDFGANGTVTFSIANIVDGNNVARPGYFRIEAATGVVRTNTDASNLDRETQDTYYVTIMLKDMGPPGFQQENSGVLTVTLSDINDQPPICQQDIYITEMSENLQSGEVIRVVAKDNDIGDNAKISYVLDGLDDSRFFSVTPINNEGSVQVGAPVDYEKVNQRFFNLTVKAQDNVGHEDTCYVEISVLDFNDNIPDIQPKAQTGNVSEAAPPGTRIATFSATDGDATPINNVFDFSISRASDPRRHFSIGARSGEVKVRRKLDRETQAVHELTILAIDKGDPALTGTASLTVLVEDVNDNFPTFKEDYNPHIMENQDGPHMVQVVLGKDPDADPYGAPFGFQQSTACGSDCSKFDLRFNPAAAGGNGSATITTSRKFDREAQKQYLIPIVMWDMRGKNSPESMTGTNTLTITIADENDNPMRPGTQDMFVYNYKGKFGPIDIGRVYVEDLDDWDLPDKTFNYTGPNWMKDYFTVDYNTGMVTMNKGVPSNVGGKPYTFTVRVYDRKWDKVVTSTVRVTVEELSEEAVRNSGATRFKGTNAEAFIKVSKMKTANNEQHISPFQHFRNLLAEKLNTDRQNVQIISVQDVEGGYTDVRYSVHGSPYYPPSQTDSIVVLNQEEFERELNLDIDEVPIDACAEEIFEGGCYNYMDITGNPALVNSNGTSFVGVEVFIRAMEGCRALDFPEPNECSGDYCYHGGTCVKNDFGVLSCVNCPEGFEGPRCQQLRHGFDGKSYAMYSTLEQCEDSHTSIEFVTEVGDGMLLYNGPLTPPAADKPQDFISLELAAGYPVLNIDHGSGAIPTMRLNGQNQAGQKVMNSLADGKWHKIDIIRKGKFVEMVVDDCQVVGPIGSENPDTSPCRVSGSTLGENSFLNVATLLYVGGRAPQHTFPPSNVVSGRGFAGCVRNLLHNSKYYDLHYKETPDVPSGENGCGPEDELCAAQGCGPHGICTATLRPPQATCVCRPGWRGSKCTEGTMVRDLKEQSFIQWQLLNSVQLPSYSLEVQVMYRTWDTDGVLFTVSTPDNTKRVTMELKDGRLQVLYNLDRRVNILLLNNTSASDGYWHVARFKRVMYTATLTLDHGEGRNRATQRDESQGSLYMTLTSSSPLYGGASVTSPSGAQVLDRDLEDTCVQDVRLNGNYLPIKATENSLATVARFVGDQAVIDGCTRPNGCSLPPPPNCPLNTVCVDLWGNRDCRCIPGYHEMDTGICQSDCEPDNPCFMDAPCSIDNGTVVCVCEDPWYGNLCNLYPRPEDEASVGMATPTIVAIVVSILLVIILLLLVFFLVTYYKRKKSRDDFDKFVVEDDADFDIRENVIFYDEEGAGEEDQRGFDLTQLPTLASETMKPPVEMMPRSRELPRGRRVPDDRPDVGDVLHDRLRDADGDPDAPPHDTLITFDEEGAGSDAGSLSSLGSGSSDASQDYDYLNDWGPKFAKLADMYGAGQE